MVKFLFDLKATRVEFSGCIVRLVSPGSWAVQVEINGVSYRRPKLLSTRLAAAKRAIGISTFAKCSGILDCQDWDIADDVDKPIIRSEYKRFRSDGLSPAVALCVARDIAEFHRNGW